MTTTAYVHCHTGFKGYSQEARGNSNGWSDLEYGGGW